jgi:heme/copper-type cytochrome/quinol oxidase subunit 3
MVFHSLFLSLVTKVIEAVYNHKHHEDLEKSKFNFWVFLKKEVECFGR